MISETVPIVRPSGATIRNSIKRTSRYLPGAWRVSPPGRSVRRLPPGSWKSLEALASPDAEGEAGSPVTVVVKDRGTSPLPIIEIPHFAGSGWAADYRVVVGVASACLAAARRPSAWARWVRIR
jgi:hypothetical protein